MSQRKGSRSRAILYPETTLGSDASITTGYVLPLVDEETTTNEQERIEAPVWTGDRRSFSSILGMKTNQGDFPLGLEFRTFGVIMKMLTGGSNAPVATAGGHMHYFDVINKDPLSFQIQKEFLEGTPVYMRQRGIRFDALDFAFQAAGAVRYGASVMGIGNEVFTDLAGTKTDHGYSGKSYFNGMLMTSTAGATPIGWASDFKFRFGNNLQRSDVCFNDGEAYDTIAANPSIGGELTLLFRTDDDLAFYNSALNDDNVVMECLWADKPLTLATQWFHIISPLSKFSKRGPAVGGPGGRKMNQTYRSEYDPTTGASGLSQTKGFVVSGLQSFVIPNPSNLGVKVNGGATVVKALTPGTRTAADIVTDLLASGGITGATSQGFPQTPRGEYGRFRIQTNTPGTAGSIQIDTATADSAHTVLGLDGTVRAGKAPQPIHSFLFNDLSATY